MATEVHASPPASRPPADPGETVSVRLQSLQLGEDERRGSGGRWLRRGLWLVALLAVAGAGAAAYQYQGGGATTAPEFDAVLFGMEKPAENAFESSGQIISHTQMNITPRSPGTIVAFPVEEGQRVKKGDLIAQVDDTSFKADYHTALANLELAGATLAELKNGALDEEIKQAEETINQLTYQIDFLEKEKDRAKELVSRKAVTYREWEQLISKLNEARAGKRSAEHKLTLLQKGPREEKILAAQAEVKRATAQVEKAKYWLDNTRLISNIDGIVVEKKAQVGEDIHPELAFTSLCVIADMNDLEAEINISEQEIAKVKVGQPCEIITDAYNDHKYHGRVERLLPRVNIARGVVTVKVKILDPDERLLLDMNCRVLGKPDPNQKPDERVATVPVSAVQSEGDKSFVFVVQGDVARRKQITPGRTTGDQIEIRDGLQKGEIVLTSAGESLKDGQPVKARLPQTT